MSLQLFLFGPPRCQQDGQPIHLHRRKSLALLAYLALNPRPHGRQALATLLYPDSANALAYLRRELSEIRQYLGDGILLTEQTISLSNDKLWVDVVEFQKLVTRANNNLPISQSLGVPTANLQSPILRQSSGQVSNLQKAISLYTTDFLSGFNLPDTPAFEEWQFFQTESLRRDLARTLSQLSQAYAVRNQLPEATAVAQRLVAFDPLHEPAQRQLMELYARNGQRAEAHRQYQTCERLLAEELGIEPEPETKQLYEQIRKGGAEVAATEPVSKKVDQEIRYFLSYDNVRIAYAIVGNGPPLVWTASFLRHLEFDWQSPIWQHWLAALASRYTLIRYDERACGLSDWNVSDISFEAWVRDLEALVDHLGLERFRLLALSQAGAVAIAYAARHPERLSHLILHGAYARGRFQRQDIPQASEEAQTLLSLTRLGWGQDNPAFRQVFSMQQMPDATKEQLAWFDELMRISMTAENAVRAEAEMYHINVLDLLPELRVPTLVTHCRHDATVPFAEGQILASQIPGAQFVPLDSKNHLLLPAEPAWEQFVRQIDRFMTAESRPFLRASISQPAAPKIPRFDWPESHRTPRSPFVARTGELAQLHSYLDEALTGNGRVVFITGGAGRGKTSLLAEFARRAQEAHSDLIVAGGVCNAYAGVGDPYLPFRELMSLLTGDVEARLAARAMTQDQARRLWQLTPFTVQMLLEHGPHLLDTFVSGKTLLTRASTAAANTVILSQLQERVSQPRPLTSLEQGSLFSEYTELLQQLARQRPLLLSLDDLHWADEASLGLLFHLGRRLAGSRILIIGTYRPDELVHGREGLPQRDGNRHPLEKVVDELQRTFGDIVINLAAADQIDGRAFVEALLDSEPNLLGESFRQALFQQTGGHPFFTVELLREMQARGSLVQNEAGQWCEAGKVDWQTIPTRVEAVIAQRLGRLDNSLQDILRVASVEGELFTLEVAAQVRGVNRRELVERFGRELIKQHRLLAAQGIERLETGGQPLSRYRFQHYLFQSYLYHSLDEIERVYQHEAVGNALEALYGDQVDEIAAQLARHFQEAGLTAKAIEYLQRAGARATRLSAYEEAIDSLHRGLALLNYLPASPENARQELNLLLALGEATRKAGQFIESLATFQQTAAIARKQGLPQELARAALEYEDSRWRFNLPAEPAAQLLEEALNALRETENILKARLWVNLARTRMTISSPEQFAAMTQQALEMARRVNDPIALFDALYLIVRGDRRPEKSAERGAMLEEMLRLAQVVDDRERSYDSYGFRLQEFLELGNMASFQVDYDIVTPLLQKLRQPFYNYYPSLIQVVMAVFAGRFADAEQFAQDALEVGRRMRVENVDGVYGMQMFSIRREQGRLRELAPLVKLFVAQNPAAATWRPGLALIYSELDLRAEAQQEFETLAADPLAANAFATLPQDALWITTITYLAEVCAYLGDRERAAILYRFLLPYDGRAIVVGFHTFCYGAAARYLGLLATTMRHWTAAERHFEDALAMNTQMGARPYLAHSQHQYAAMLLAQGKAEDQEKATALLNEAMRTAQELGMGGLIEKIEVIR